MRATAAASASRATRVANGRSFIAVVKGKLAGVIGVGIVGYGLAGRVMHANLIRRVPELEIRAVVTRDPARREQAAGDGVAKVYDERESRHDDGQSELGALATRQATHA